MTDNTDAHVIERRIIDWRWDYVNARTGPGIYHEKIGRYELGEIVEIVEWGQAANGAQWCAAKTDGWGIAWFFADASKHVEDPDIVREFKWEAWPTKDYGYGVLVTGEFGNTGLNQMFGANPSRYEPYNLPGHEGLDFHVIEGDPIFAIAPGRVYRVERDDVGNYGKHVRIQHPHGYKTIYAHLDSVAADVGEHVEAGDLIGRGGNTGNSSGPHLHLTLKHAPSAIYPWDIVDPTPYLREYLELNDGS